MLKAMEMRGGAWSCRCRIGTVCERNDGKITKSPRRGLNVTRPFGDVSGPEIGLENSRGACSSAWAVRDWGR